jgi:zonular occludens toxin Zot
VLSIVEGHVGAGKSFWAAHKVAETLADTRRPIFTNLPLNRHRLAAYATTVLCGKKWLKWDGSLNEQTVARWESYVRRLHIITDAQVYTMYDLPLLGAMIFFDELATIFSAQDRKIPKAVNTWICQHRHAHQDIYVMSQSAADVHVAFRRHSTKVYRMRNGLGLSIWENKYFRWMCWPVQFFKAEEWRMNAGKVVGKDGIQASRSLWPYLARRKVFGCYDSFSKPEGLVALNQSVDGYDPSEDQAIWEEGVMKRILKQVVANSTMVGLTIACAVAAILGFRWILKLANPDKTPAAVVATAGPGPIMRTTIELPSGARSVAVDADGVALLPIIDAVGLTGESVILRNGAIWRIGSWIIVDGLECGLVDTDCSQLVYWWGVRDQSGKVISASRSQLSSGGRGLLRSSEDK